MIGEAGSAGSSGATSLEIFQEACNCMSEGDFDSPHCEEVLEESRERYENLSDQEKEKVEEMMSECM